MKRLFAAALFSLLSLSQALAANRFWVPLVVTGAVSGTGGLCRLTVTPGTSGLTSGDAVVVASITGATECNGTTTVTTVVDTTHVEVNLTFSVAYVSGGTVAGGEWTATNTNNWAATTGGTGGQTVPGSGDAVIFDANCGSGSTVVVNSNFNITSLVEGACAGTLDFSVNNNNVTLQTFNGNGSAVRTLNMGNGVWTLTGSSAWSTFSATNLTFNANSSTINLTNTTTTPTIFSTASSTYHTITINVRNGTFEFSNLGTGPTITALNINGPALVGFTGNTTINIGTLNTITGPGTSIGLQSTVLGTAATISIASGVSTISWSALHDLTFTGGATFTAPNSFDLGHNSGITITPPSPAGSAGTFGFGFTR